MVKFDEEFKEKLNKRITYLKLKAEEGKTLTVKNPYNGKVWLGIVKQIEGEDGEIKFLEKLLEEDRTSV